MRTVALLSMFLLFSIGLTAQITEIGKASFYGEKFQGQVTASGEIFDFNKFTAAHRSLPFGTLVKVTNLSNKKSIEVRINDRGPFVKERVIDISKIAAEKLGFVSDGTIDVRVEVIKLASADSRESVSEKSKKDSTPAKKPSEMKEKKPEPIKTTPKEQTSEKLETTPINSKPETNTTTTETGSKFYYQVKSEALTQAGFGVQILSYREAANLMMQVSDLEKKYKQAVVVQVSGESGQRLYRIILGNFTERAMAEKLKEQIKKEFNGCFVVEMR